MVARRVRGVVSWVLLRRAADAGELRPAELQQPARRLGDASDTDSEALAAMPERARLIIEASSDLYQRIKRLDDEMMRNAPVTRSEEHTSELQSLMRNSYAVFCLKKKKKT